jgi:hypothetical protein
MFVPLIDDVPGEFQVVDVEGEYQVLTAIAESEDGIRIVSILTSLIPFEHNGAQAHELKFGISVSGDEADEAFVLYQRDMAIGFIPKEIRHLVMPCVCRAIEALVGVVRPSAVYRVTKAISPPEKALSKHHMITDTLLRLGYIVQETGRDRFNRVYWILTE